MGEAAYEKLDEAKAAALRALAGAAGVDPTWVSVVLANSAKVVDILTTTEKSLPKARAVNGGKKSRKSKGQSTAAQAVVSEFNRIASQAAAAQEQGNGHATTAV